MFLQIFLFFEVLISYVKRITVRKSNKTQNKPMSSTKISPLAGKLPPHSLLTNIEKLVSAYYSEKPDFESVDQRVSFGTSGHRGSSLNKTFNEFHVLAISQAICEYRKQNDILGPLFLGIDTHALSYPAYVSALEVLAANEVTVMLAENDEYTPTPVISHAILVYNKGRKSDFADGIVITPSHNPPADGGFKYNPPNGGPADSSITSWIQNRANEILKFQLKDVKRLTLEKALKLSSTKFYDYITPYVADIESIIDVKSIENSKIKMGVDPLGGAGVSYWERIKELYKFDLTVVNPEVDSTFRFMSMDWDGKIRMDPSSFYAMESLISLKDKFEIAFACDTDHDRHGIVTKSSGLMPPNHYLTSSIYYLFQNRPQWRSNLAIGKTLVSSQMINKVADEIGRAVFEVPVGFKWFVDGLYKGNLGFVGEESAGATFLRKDGEVWTTDKDGIVPALLSAEITAKTGKDPAEIYKSLTDKFGESVYDRVEAPASPADKKILSNLSPEQVKATTLAGENIEARLVKAPGNNASIGGLKIVTKNGWFAARPSGTEDIYKIYAESLLGQDHLKQIINEAQEIVDNALKNK
jgi:phosphoglucomutase